MTETVKATKKWTEELVAQLTATVGTERPVSAETVIKAAAELDISARSVASKLRNLGIEVASLAKTNAPVFDAEDSEALAAFVKSNEGRFTYKEIAERFADGEFTAKQIQGKLLALELTSLVKPAEKVEAVRTYTPAEEAQFIKMASSGAFLEEIAAALGKTVASVRGKALSLTRSGDLDAIPAQRDYVVAAQDALEALGDVSGMKVEEIAAQLGRSERGVRTMLTRRGIKVANYDGAAKKATAEGRRAEKAAA